MKTIKTFKTNKKQIKQISMTNIMNASIWYEYINSVGKVPFVVTSM